MPTSILDYPSILSVSHWLGRLEVDGSSPGTQFALLLNQLEKIKVGNLLYMSKTGTNIVIYFLSQLLHGCIFDNNLLNFPGMLPNIHLTMALKHLQLYIEIS